MEEDRTLLIRCLDLTSIGDGDDERSIDDLCRRATHIDGSPGLQVAAVCIWPRFVPRAKRRLARSPVRVACVSGGFPLPDGPLGDRLDEIRSAVDAGADEVDVVVNRFLLDEPDALVGELAATREAAGDATWKAILETGALAPDEVRVLAAMAIDAGADFLKTSTGKAAQGVTPEAAEVVAEVIRAAPRDVGCKLSGGIRGAGQAANYLALIRSILGDAWPTPRSFRIGASGLLDTLLEVPSRP